MYANYVVWVVVGGLKDDFSRGSGYPSRKGHIFGASGPRNVTYRQNVSLWCGCNVPAAD